MKNNVSTKELSKIQKLGCLAITGAMKVTPRAAMEVLVGLPALHVMIEAMIEAEARTGVYRIMYTQQWRPKYTNFSHTKKSRHMEREPILQMESDKMLHRYVYRKPLSV
jgi:hypothetical protein